MPTPEPRTLTCPLCPAHWLQSERQAHLLLLPQLSPGHPVTQTLQSHQLPSVSVKTEQEAPEGVCQCVSVGVGLCGCEICVYFGVSVHVGRCGETECSRTMARPTICNTQPRKPACHKSTCRKSDSISSNHNPCNNWPHFFPPTFSSGGANMCLRSNN